MQIDINNPHIVHAEIKNENKIFQLQTKMNILFKKRIEKLIQKENAKEFHFEFDYYGNCSMQWK